MVQRGCSCFLAVTKRGGGILVAGVLQEASCTSYRSLPNGWLVPFQGGVDTVIPKSHNETRSSSFSHTIPERFSQNLMLSGKVT